jgi:hypothetical protein
MIISALSKKAVPEENERGLKMLRQARERKLLTTQSGVNVVVIGLDDGISLSLLVSGADIRLLRLVVVRRVYRRRQILGVRVVRGVAHPYGIY